jgi:restriction system protein
MGYGSGDQRTSLHLGRSGDEGIDGCINQDPLGLDQIMVQAKRHAPDRPVDRHAVQAFIGSLAGQGVTKGVLITTSYFNENALEFVKRGTNTKVVLVDGKALVGLMMRHHIGVRVKERVELLELDQN